MPEAKSPAEMVLLVEDEVLIRFMLADYLRECGYRVVEAATTDEALLVLEQPDVKVDVLLTDVEMPGQMDGFGLAKWTRANRPDVVVLVAGSISRAAHAASDLCDEGPLLTKPYEPQVVVDRIKRLLASRGRKQRGS
jgi:DNA-binding response OmpR family regulator